MVADRETAIERSIIRNQIDRTAAEKRIDSQLSNEERTSRADTVIENNGDQSELIARLETEWARVSN